MPDDYISVDAAATIIGVTPGRVRQMLRSEKLPGWKLHDMAWLIDPQDAEKAAANRPPVGRPPKKRRGRK